MCAKYLYLIDGRVSEGVSRAYPSDHETTPRGPKGTDARMSIWYSPEFSSQADARRAQKDDGVRRVFPAVVFTVATAKRKGLPRYCAVPIDSKYEPWTMELFKYFEDAGNDPVFDIVRQRVYTRAKRVFKGLAYVIENYSVVLDRTGIITGIKDEPKSVRVDRRLREFTLHALRHLRASDLSDYYDFNGINLSAFGGWTLSTSMRKSRSVDRSLVPDWKSYFPKLLKARY